MGEISRHALAGRSNADDRVLLQEYGRYLRKAAAVLREHALPLAQLDALNNGNPVSALAMDAGFAADCLDYFAGLTTEIKGETIPMGDGNFNYTLQEPLGVIARIVAYNHPLMFAAARLAGPPCFAARLAHLQVLERCLRNQQPARHRRIGRVPARPANQ